MCDMRTPSWPDDNIEAAQAIPEELYRAFVQAHHAAMQEEAIRKMMHDIFIKGYMAGYAAGSNAVRDICFDAGYKNGYDKGRRSNKLGKKRTATCTEASVQATLGPSVRYHSI